MNEPIELACSVRRIQGLITIRAPSQVGEQQAKTGEENDSEPELRWAGMCVVAWTDGAKAKLWRMTGQDAPCRKPQACQGSGYAKDDPKVAINSGRVRVVLHSLCRCLLRGLTPELSRAAKRRRLE